MDTSRAQINIFDNSTALIEEPTAITGFTVVKAPKGPVTPVLIDKGGAAKIQDIFGVSSKEYPELFEVETFNREYAVYVSAPYGYAEVPVAYVTSFGVIPASKNIQYTQKIENLILNGDECSIDISTGATVLCDVTHPEVIDEEATLDTKNYGYPKFWKDSSSTPAKSYVLINTGLKKSKLTSSISKINLTLGKTSWDFNINGTSLEIPYGENSTAVVGSLKKVTEPSGTETAYTIADLGNDDIVWIVLTGEVKSGDTYGTTFTEEFVATTLDSEESREKAKVSWVKSITKDDVYAIILPKYPSERPLHISFSGFSDREGYSNKSWKARNILKMRVYEEGAFRDGGAPIDIVGSLDKKDVDGNGGPIGFIPSNSSYGGQELIYVHVLKAFNETSPFNKGIKKYSDIVLEGGLRTFKEKKDDSDEIDSLKLHEYGWAKAAESEFSDVDIFFDSSLHEKDDKNTLGKSKFFTMATDDVASHELAGYIFNKTLDPASILDSNGREISGLANEKLTFGKNYWNICNVGIINDTREGNKFSVALTGAKALMQCRIIENKRGGAAPEFLNEGDPGLGGQLDMISVERLKYKYNKKMLDILDTLNYNPVIDDRQYGLMVTGHKTCKSGDISDWSYIGHACAFFNFLKQVRENVMIPQIGKPNNPYYRTLRKDQVDLYLADRLNGSDRIWAEASCDTSTADGVNDVYALKARKFIIKVRVKVDVFSETVVLNFINEDQETRIYTE